MSYYLVNYGGKHYELRQKDNTYRQRTDMHIAHIHDCSKENAELILQALNNLTESVKEGKV